MKEIIREIKHNWSEEELRALRAGDIVRTLIGAGFFVRDEEIGNPNISDMTIKDGIEYCRVQHVEVRAEKLLVKLESIEPLVFTGVHIGEDYIRVESESDILVKVGNVSQVFEKDIKNKIKELRAKCKEAGVRLTVKGAKGLKTLMLQYNGAYAEYQYCYRQAKEVVQEWVAGEVYKGVLDDAKYRRIGKLSGRLQELTYRSTPIHKVNQLVWDIDSYLNDRNLKDYSKIYLRIS